METVQDLVRIWRSTCHPRGWSEAVAARARLYTAAVHTIAAKANENIPYDPKNDIHFQWADQWIELGEGQRKAIDEDIEFTLNLRLTPCPPCSGKSLAAADP